MTHPILAQTRARVLDLIPHQAIRQLSRMKAFSRRRSATRRFAPLVADIVPGATKHELLVAFDDSAVFRVEQGAGGPTILKIASSPLASQQLTAEADALDELTQLSELADWRNRIASVVDRGDHATGTWFTQSFKAGRPLSTIDTDAVQLVTAVATALHPVHAATSLLVKADAEVLSEIVTSPLETIQNWRPELAENLASIDADLRKQLTGRELTLSRLHGDYAPSNVLWDPETQTVSGIVDWKFGRQFLLPETDLVHFVLSLISQRRQEEYGTTVIRLLDAAPSPPLSAAVLAAIEAGPNGLDLRTGLTASWLHHVSFGLQKAEELRANPIWLRNNIDSVADALASRG